MLPSSQTASFALFLQKARQLDLSPIAYQLMQSTSGPCWTRTKTIKAIAQYLAFLYLTDRHSHLQLVPSLTVDRVWHYHILDTYKYAEDCQLLFGYMIHHFPYLGLRGEQDRYNQRRAYHLTQALLKKHFLIHSMDQDPRLADCEPIRNSIGLEAISNQVSDNRTLHSRPQVALDIEEVLTNIQRLSEGCYWI
jgi:hypothetical protein